MPDSTEHDGCEHPFDLHVIISSTEPPVYGFGVCPVIDCKCYFTWGLGRNSKKPTLADLGMTQHEIEQIRTRIQMGEM